MTDKNENWNQFHKIKVYDSFVYLILKQSVSTVEF